MCTWQVDSSIFSPGRYKLKIVSNGGCSVQSPAFEITGCDYALESVTFTNNRPLSRGVDASSGREISGRFKVTVRWNRLSMAPGFDSAETITNLLTVKSIRTGEAICDPETGVNFDYSQALDLGRIVVIIPFKFLRDDIPDMRNADRQIPLEFKIHPQGISLDVDASNNTRTADLRVNNAVESDFQLRMDSGDLTVTERESSEDSVRLFRVSQTIHLKNLSRNDIGGPPAPLHNVKVMVYVLYRNADRAGGAMIPVYGSQHYFSPVTEDSNSFDISGDYSIPDNAPDRIYQLKVVVDQENNYLDPNRDNNTAIFTFDAQPH